MLVAGEKLRPRTMLSYRQNYDNHVLPIFGSRRVATVTSTDVEAWVVSLRRSGLSASTVQKNFVALNKVFKYALRHRFVTANPCTGTPLPRATSANVFSARFLTPAEADAVAAELDQYPPYGLLVRFATSTRLRAGELAGLQVGDINLARKDVAVRRTVQRVKGGWVTGPPKSARSSRHVPLLRPGVVSELAAYLDEHPGRDNPTAALWPGRHVGTHALDWDRQFDHQSFYRWYFRPPRAP